jgi:hypothetical protein
MGWSMVRTLLGVGFPGEPAGAVPLTGHGGQTAPQD